MFCSLVLSCYNGEMHKKCVPLTTWFHVKVWINGRTCITLPLTMAGNDSQEWSEKLGWREKVEEVELKTIVSAEVQLASLHRLHLVTNGPPPGILYLEKITLKKKYWISTTQECIGLTLSPCCTCKFFKKMKYLPKRKLLERKTQHSFLILSYY